jgi:hypothetical protein
MVVEQTYSQDLINFIMKFQKLEKFQKLSETFKKIFVKKSYNPTSLKKKSETVKSSHYTKLNLIFHQQTPK